jgi:L-cysteine/cystine lyase
MLGELRVTAGQAAGTTIALGDELLIGRATGGIGRLGDDPAISLRHARIVPTKGGLPLVVDMGSESGTWVNGERVMTRVLANGDVLRFGNSTLELAGAPALRNADRAEDAANARALRAEFPIFERVLYLNAGMEGPVPARGILAAQGQLEAEMLRGRSGAEHWGNLEVLASRLREGYARALGCRAEDVGLTRATCDGVYVVLNCLRFAAGDEILTTDEEHHGVYVPLAVLRERCGCRIRVVPFDDLANAVTSTTRMIVCSHVSWRTGRVIDTQALKATGKPVLLDGAQALGAIPLDMDELGCDFYAASGQKWLFGPDRTGSLYVRPDRIADLSPPITSNFFTLADKARPLDLVLSPGARRFDPGNLPGSTALWALAALDIIEEAGLRWITERGPVLAGRLAKRLRDAGLRVEPRGASTLVSFTSAEAPRVVEAFATSGIVVRDVQGCVRISIGAYCLDEDIDRVVDVAARFA